MASLAIVGAGILAGGAAAPLLGGTALLGAQLGFVGGSILGGILFPPDPIQGPRLSDLKVSASTYGKPFPICYGTMRTGGNMIWGLDIKEVKQTDTSGGLFGFGGQKTVTFTYFGNFAIAFTAGPAAAITRVWADGKLIIDLTSGGQAVADVVFEKQTSDITTGRPPISPSDVAVSGISLGKVQIYLGTETQLPDPWIQADKGVDDTPAYRGLTYIVFQDLPLADYGNRNPQITAEISCNTTVAYPTDSMNFALNPSLSRWHPNYQHLYTSSVSGETVWKIDALSMKIITSGELRDEYEFGGNTALNPLFTFDSAGNFFAWDGKGLSARFYYIDGDTFQILEQSGLDSDVVGEFSGTLVKGGVITGGGCLVVIADVQGIIGSWDHIGQSQTFGSGFIPVVSEYSTGMNLEGITLDIFGRVWVLATGSGASPTGATILQVDPNTAAPLAQYDFAGHDAVESPLFYDVVTDSLYWIVDVPSPMLVRFRLDTFTVDATVKLSGGFQSQDVRGAAGNGSWNGRFWVQESLANQFVEIDLVSMTKVRTLVNDGSTWNAGNLDRFIYSPRQHAVIGGSVWLYLDRESGASVALSDIVDDISERVNVTAAERSTAALTARVHGYFVTGRMSARRALEPLQSAYFFDVRESDWKAEFVERSGAVVASIPEDDLGVVATPDGTGQTPEIEETRGQELELPERIDVTYSDVSIDHQTMTQHAKRAREAIRTRDLVEIVLPIAFVDGDEPAGIAEKALYSAYAERTRYALSMTWEHIRLDPGDPIEVTRGGATFRARLVQSDWGADGVLQLKAVSEDPSTYVSFKAGAVADGFVPQVIEQTGPTALQLMDSPLWRDVDERTGPVVRIGCGGHGSGNWPGAQVYRSNDNIDFSDDLVFFSSGRNMTWGSATSVLADGTTTVWDTANSVTLRLVRGSLSSSTRAAVLDGANTIQIGDEIVQFVTVVDNGDDTATISDLLRGRRGTEWATTIHIANERVVLLTALTVVGAEVGTDEVGKTRHYKAVTVGGSFNDANSKALAFLGRSKMPYSPAHITATRTAGTWTITWVRRTRLGGQWQDQIDVPLGEAGEDYEVDILGGSTVLRTITTTASANGSVVTVASHQAVYDTADVDSDFGSPTPGTLTVKVYQLAVQGRGFPGDATLAA